MSPFIPQTDMSADQITDLCIEAKAITRLCERACWSDLQNGSNGDAVPQVAEDIQFALRLVGKIFVPIQDHARTPQRPEKRCEMTADLSSVEQAIAAHLHTSAEARQQCDDALVAVCAARPRHAEELAVWRKYLHDIDLAKKIDGQVGLTARVVKALIGGSD